MRQSVAGKRVLITGAARGIGAGTAAELAQMDVENQKLGATWR